MRRMMAIALLFAAVACRAFDFNGNQMDRLLDAISQVESRGNAAAIGDGGKAVGAFQLHKAYVTECNRVAHTAYTAADRADAAKSREITRAVLAYWGRRLEKALGRPATAGEIAKIHNGFRWWTRSRAENAKYHARLDAYAAKVEALLAK